VGGVTAIQGTSGDVRLMEEEALVRNVDRLVFGQQRGRAMIDLPSGQRGMSSLKSILDGIAAGSVRAFYLHLAEGRHDNERSVKEFARMVELDALHEQTVVIHGTALNREHFDAMKQVGAKLVWSPQSNLRLYGQTTRAGEALAAGPLVGLGADWLPSGSTSLLAELKVARRALADEGKRPAPKRLVRMVTSDAAKIAGFDDRLGVLKAGHAADILVLERREQDPFENVVEADPSWVELVVVDGELAYGRADWMSDLSDPGDRGRLEPLIAWARRCGSIPASRRRRPPPSRRRWPSCAPC
jgi:5-methylthioadenosine/S-adenosylhomocysteine deaminase